MRPTLSERLMDIVTAVLSSLLAILLIIMIAGVLWSSL